MKIKKWTILSSPFVHKRAQETYELRRYRRLILFEADSSTTRQFLHWVKATQEPTAAIKVTEVSYFPKAKYYGFT